MAEETVNVQAESTPQEKATVTEPTVTFDDLSSAYDDAQKEQTTETQTEEAQAEQVTEGEQVEQTEQEPPQDEQHEEPTDNAERSRLGRRLKSLEDGLNKLLARFETPTPTPQQQEQVAQVPDNVTYDKSFMKSQIEAAIQSGRIPETIVTPEDQYTVNEFIGEVRNYMNKQFAVGYINMLKSPSLKGDTPDDIHAEVVAELQNVQSPFNLRRYDNPKLDAQLNYLEAKNAVLTKRLATGTKPESVFKGKPKDSPPTGTSVSTRTTTVTDELPPLDEASQDFIKRTGMSVESVKSALKEEMPLHLRGRR